MINLLLDAGDDPLYVYTHSCNTIVKILTFLHTQNGSTMLMSACGSPLVNKRNAEPLSIVKRLLEARVPINHAAYMLHRYPPSPLTLLSSHDGNNLSDVVKKLINRGADLNAAEREI